MVKRFYSFDSIPVVRPEGVVNNSNQHSLGDRTIETVGEVRSIGIQANSFARGCRLNINHPNLSQSPIA